MGRNEVKSVTAIPGFNEFLQPQVLSANSRHACTAGDSSSDLGLAVIIEMHRISIHGRTLFYHYCLYSALLALCSETNCNQPQSKINNMFLLSRENDPCDTIFLNFDKAKERPLTIRRTSSCINMPTLGIGAPSRRLSSGSSNSTPN
ncbi:hypothetical protein PIB30_051330 [Stylosanthes scabra]|uniref:Uncharacterized protein n=1 Tax=Stylosanthes scabra TaxID=79078 RepID=A0ABU6UH94_9FABA|nr:hypothetical protein [Stylosanthes scabra]